MPERNPILELPSHSGTLIFRYFLRYFSSTHRTDLSRFRGTFHSFDPVGFAIFAIRAVMNWPCLSEASMDAHSHLTDDFGLDLVEITELLTALEERFGVDAETADEPNQIEFVGDLIRYIESRKHRLEGARRL
jgi:acyl carrier protein